MTLATPANLYGFRLLAVGFPLTYIAVSTTHYLINSTTFMVVPLIICDNVLNNMEYEVQ